MNAETIYNYRLLFTSTFEPEIPFETIQSIAQKWSKDEILIAIDDDLLTDVELEEAVFLDGEFSSIDSYSITWKQFFKAYDEVVKSVRAKEKGVIPKLLRNYADTIIDWNDLILIHEDGSKVPEKKGLYSYQEIEDFYNQGMFFVDLNKGKLSIDEIFNIDNPLWAVVTPEDVSTMVDLSVEDIRTNALSGLYGRYRFIGQSVVFCITDFADFHSLV
jgi:hypothetical protein